MKRILYCFLFPIFFIGCLSVELDKHRREAEYIKEFVYYLATKNEFELRSRSVENAYFLKPSYLEESYILLRHRNLASLKISKIDMKDNKCNINIYIEDDKYLYIYFTLIKNDRNCWMVKSVQFSDAFPL